MPPTDSIRTSPLPANPATSDQTAINAPELLTVQDAAKLLRKSRTTMFRLVESGQVQAFQVAGKGRLLFRREDLFALLTPVSPASLTEVSAIVDATKGDADNE